MVRRAITGTVLGLLLSACASAASAPRADPTSTPTPTQVGNPPCAPKVTAGDQQCVHRLSTRLLMVDAALPGHHRRGTTYTFLAPKGSIAASATLARPVPGVWVTATRIHHVNGFSNVRIYLNRPTDKATRFLVSFYSR